MSQPVTDPGRGPPRWARIVAVALAIQSSLAWLILLCILVVKVPRFEEIFHKFEMPDMPLLTALAIRVSHVVAGYWYVFGVLWCATAAVLVSASALAKSRRAIGRALVCSVASAVVGGVAVGMVIHSLFGFLKSLIESSASP